MGYLNDAGVTRFASWVKTTFATVASLSQVATSGDYSDLSGKPANATQSVAGLMSSSDKTKLDGIAMSNYYTKSEVESYVDSAIGALDGNSTAY